MRRLREFAVTAVENKILKTLAFFSDIKNGIIYRVDTIEYKGTYWLVPGWLDNPAGGWRIPERIIRLDILPYQESPGGPADFVLNSGIPKSVFDGQIQPEQEGQYIVIERPDIRFPSIGG